MSARGRLITLEGVDGAGKSSHIQFIADAIGAQGRPVIVSREPGGTELAERLRKALLEEPMAPMAETLLLFAARADHVARVIRPALDAGSWVICDRFSDATLAYQGAGKGVDRDLIGRLCEASHPGLRPDRTLVFDCSYDVARERLAASGRKLDRFEREDRAFFDRVRDAYLGQAEAEPERVRIIDAATDLWTIRRALEKNLVFR